ncbi:MAG TPA: hypothetical protein VE779_13980 [Candidatus Angelobacter sp.]|nr:hypothetical protein [Candidatus Angelobacter sp.]
MATKYRVIMVRGAEPEAFIVVGIDFDAGLIKTTSATMSESSLRQHLQRAGATQAEVDEWIHQGRTYPG